ncbi:hypothetical protein CsSME_00026160 [Camellia sinensis var. sinensis]
MEPSQDTKLDWLLRDAFNRRLLIIKRHLLDISNAFLHGVLEEEVYMLQPLGFVHPTQSTHKTATTITVLLVYVDDILLTGNNDAHIKSLVAHMHEAFSMKELGLVSYFLGISIQSTGVGYTLSQQKYTHNILVRVGLSECKPCSSPMSVKPSLTSSSIELFDNPSLYRNIVRALQYLTITRPDIAFTVNQLCQYMHALTVSHFSTVKRLLQFIKGTLSHGLSYTPSSFDIHAFSDSNWAGDSSDHKSVGYTSLLECGTQLIY